MRLSSALAQRVALALVIGGTGACSGTPPLPPSLAAAPVEHGSGCATSTVRIDFDFDEAPASRCVIRGERSFAILIGPEHAPPINPSPWYAFRYRSSGSADISVELDYLGAAHRYAPKLTVGGTVAPLSASVAADGMSATLSLPAGEGIVSGQELFGSDRYDALLDRLAALSAAERLTLGTSLDGRLLSAVHIGDTKAPRLVVLIGRAHPPEITGALAMDAFLRALADEIAAGRVDTAATQFLILPLLNPDGVARGHWRANRGGVDLNRDWGIFSQPETRAVKTWLDRLPAGVRPVAMVDFHSTQHSLFYVQGADETTPAEEAFLAAWLGGKEKALPGYPFTIERRNANPGSGTSKNWFHATYGIPAYTYEAGDEADRAGIDAAARNLARAFLTALPLLAR